MTALTKQEVKDEEGVVNLTSDKNALSSETSLDLSVKQLP